jgi:hypothetical protein
VISVAGYNSQQANQNPGAIFASLESGTSGEKGNRAHQGQGQAKPDFITRPATCKTKTILVILSALLAVGAPREEGRSSSCKIMVPKDDVGPSSLMPKAPVKTNLIVPLKSSDR